MAILDIVSFGARVNSTAGGGGATTGGNVTNRKLRDGLTGTPVYGAHPDGATGHYGQHVTTANTFSSITLSSTPAKFWVSFLWRCVTAPTSTSRYIMQIVSTAGVTYSIRQNFTSGKPLETIISDGTGFITPFLSNPVVGQDYWIDCLIDMTSPTNHTMDVWVDDVYINQNPNPGVPGSDTAASIRIGDVNANVDSVGYDYWVSDMFVAAGSDNRYGPHRTTTCVPNAVGTHNETAGDFTNDTGATVNIGETTSWSKLDEWPPNTTDYVRQVVNRTTSYLEYNLESSPAEATAKAICIMCASFPIATNTANEAGMRLFDRIGATVTSEAVWDNSVATNTLEYHRHVYPARPGGLGAWTKTSADSIRIRVGYSNDTSPVPAWSALLAEIVAQALTVKTPSDSGVGIDNGDVLTSPHTNVLDGNVDGNNVLTTDALGGDEFSVVFVSSGTITYDSTQKAHGKLSAKITGQINAGIGWTNLAGNANPYSRAYLRFDALPAAPIQMIKGVASGVIKWQVELTATGALTINNGAGTVKGTSSTTLSANTWYRLEMSASNTNQLVLRIYTSMDSRTIAETVTASDSTNFANSEIRFGNPESGQTLWFDNLAANGTDWWGPAQGDVAAGSDSSKLTVHITRTESGAATDVITGRVFNRQTDSGTATDAITKRVITRVESGTGTESIPVRKYIQPESAVAIDVSSSNRKSSTDSAIAADIIGNRKIVTNDSAAGSDASLSKRISVTDSGSGSDKGYISWRFVTSHGGASTKTPGTGLAFNPVSTIPSGDVFVVFCVSDNIDLTTGATNAHVVTDNTSSSVYTKISEFTNSPGGVAGDGLTISMWITQVTTQILSSNTVTLSFSSSTQSDPISYGTFGSLLLGQSRSSTSTPLVAAKAIMGAQFSPTNGMVFSINATRTGHAEASTSSPVLSVSGLNDQRHLIVAGSAFEGPTGDVWTSGGDYAQVTSQSTSGGAADTNLDGELEYDIDDTINTVSQSSIDNARDWASILVVIDQVAVGAASKSASDSGAGTTFISRRTISLVDSGTATDTSQTNLYKLTDSGVGIDAIGGRRLGTADSGLATDFTGNRSLGTMDSATGSDVSAVSKKFSTTDSASGADVTGIRALGVFDTASATDITLNRALTRFESGVGTDRSSGGGGRTLTVFDSGAGNPNEVLDVYGGLTFGEYSAYFLSSGELDFVAAMKKQLFDSAAATDISIKSKYILVQTVVATDYILNRKFSTVDSAVATEQSGRKATPVDTGVGNDFAVNRVMVLNDSAVGTDRTSTKLNTPIDSGAATDVSTLTVHITRTESGVGSNVSTLTVHISRTDSGAGITSITNRVIVTNDSGGLVSEVSQRTAVGNFLLNDTAVGVDMVGNRSLGELDPAVATDVTARHKISVFDSAHGNDVGSPLHRVVDAGIATEISKVTFSTTRTDSGHGTDTSNPTTTFHLSDSAAGTDSSTFHPHILPIDTATSVETTSQPAGIKTVFDHAIGTESITLTVQVIANFVFAFDAGLGTDHQDFGPGSRIIGVLDELIAAEYITLAVSLPVRNDNGIGTDHSTLFDHLRHRPHPPVPDFPETDETFYKEDNIDVSGVVSGGHPDANEDFVTLND